MTGRHRLGEPIAQHRAPHQPTSGLRKAAVAGAFAVVLLGIGVATEPTTMHEPAPLLATPPPAPAQTADPDTPMTDPPLLTPAPTVIHHHTRPRPLPVPASVTERVSAPTTDPTVAPATEQPAADAVPAQAPAPVPMVRAVQPTYTAWSQPYYSQSYPTYPTRTRHHRHTHRSDD